MVRRNNKSRRNQRQNKRQNKRNTRKQNGGNKKRGKAMIYVPLKQNRTAAKIEEIINSMGEQQPGDLYYLVRLRDE